MKGSRFKKTIKFWFPIGLAFGLILILVIGFYFRPKQIEPVKFDFQQSNFLKPSVNPETSPVAEEILNIPDSYTIQNVPFQSQAPLVNWDQLHNEACEEASINLVYYYLKNKPLTSEEMDQQILTMVKFEKPDGSDQENLTVEKTLKLAQDFYKIDGKVIYNASISDLKKEIALNHPVIVPTAGRLLGNPNFRQPGPVYHMVVAIGYDEKNIIVQDVGTHNGDHYIYNQMIFANAWHDWVGSDANIEQGSKNMLVLSLK